MDRILYSILLGFVSVFIMNFVAYTMVTLNAFNPVAFFNQFVRIDFWVIMGFQSFMIVLMSIIYYVTSFVQFFIIDSDGNTREVTEKFLDKQE